MEALDKDMFMSRYLHTYMNEIGNRHRDGIVIYII